MSKDCNYREVSASQNRDEAIRDAFISGLLSSLIRQRLLENNTLTLEAAFDQARALESAKKRSDSYRIFHALNLATTSVVSEDTVGKCALKTNEKSVMIASNKRCYFCGLKYHPRSGCHAQDATCNKCNKIGHYQKVC